METRTLHCPNCSAPLRVEIGQVDAGCAYCGSRLRFVPGRDEMEVVKTREEMKRKERVEVQRLVLENELRQQEAERWRHLAGRVAISALPVLGETAGRAVFRATVRRGCLGCGCLVMLAFGAAAGAVAALR